MKSRIAIAAVVAATLAVSAAPAMARYRHHHHGGGWGWGAGAGFAAGALLGGALAARPYYYGPGPYYYDDYAYEAGPGGGSVAYCMQRFKSYNPATGTYLGYDGRRHPCP